MNPNSQIIGPTQLSVEDQDILFCVVNHIIPSSAEFGTPSANDPEIFADILNSLGQDLTCLRQALEIIDGMADGCLSDLPQARQSALLARFRVENMSLASVLQAITARCYYRDDRVMISIGMEARPPYPIGFELKQGDWSLLDPVRARGKIYRDAG